MQNELVKRDIEFIRRSTERRGIIVLEGPHPEISSLRLDEDYQNRTYVQDDIDAAREAGIGAGMHICYERHLSRGK